MRNAAARQITVFRGTCSTYVPTGEPGTARHLTDECEHNHSTFEAAEKCGDALTRSVRRAYFAAHPDLKEGN